MKSNNGSTYWASNPDWYYIDKTTDSFCLKNDAPERAKQSFELWKQQNNLDFPERKQS